MFPIKIGGRGRSNGRVVQAERSGRIPYAVGRLYWWQCYLRVGGFTGESDGIQEIALNDLASTRLTFPTNVWREVAYLKPVTAFSGGNVNACTAELGDANDPNGLVTAIDVFTGSSLLGIETATAAAAEFAPRTEAAFVPTVTIRTTNGNTEDLTAGVLVAVIGFRKYVDLR